MAIRLLKTLLAVLVAFAAYVGYNRLILGMPADPEQAVAQWAQEAKARTPSKIDEAITLVAVDAVWHDARGAANLYTDDLKKWTETYEVRGPREQSTLEQASDSIVGLVCRDDTRRKIMRLMNIELIIRTPTEHIRVDPAEAFRLGSPVRTIYPLEKRVAVSKASCV